MGPKFPIDIKKSWICFRGVVFSEVSFSIDYICFIKDDFA